MSEIRRRRWPRITQWLVLIFTISIIIALAIYAWAKIIAQPAQPPIATNEPILDISQLVDQTQNQQGEFIISAVEISRKGAKNIIHAKLKYTGREPANARLNFTLKNTTNGQLQASKYESIEGLQPGEEREIEASIVGDFSRSNVYQITVEKY